MLKKVRNPSPPYVDSFGEKLALEIEGKSSPRNLSFNTFSILGDLS